jgi:pilus assembly protein CpaD
MHSFRTTIAGRRLSAAPLLRAAVVFGFGALLCGCQTDQPLQTSTVPTDYRMRHPITITEAEHTLQLLIGANRATLTGQQRADLLAFAQTWKTEATGGVLIDLPTGTANQHSSAAALNEIRSILAATGVPPNNMMVRTYPSTPNALATVKVTYPRLTAQAGPCGIWPENIGPSFDRDYFENQPHWNFGCSTQHNLAAMVANPADLMRPQPETPSDSARRTQALTKYREGQSTATQYPNSETKISDF